VILDASAVIAVVLRESDTDRLQIKLSAADEVAIGAPSLVEVSIALTHRMGPAVAGSLVQSFLNRFEVSILAFEPRHWRVAIEAFRRYGKGRHPAALNFGDCLAYATARVAGRPLLATGDDFVKTDLVVA
jgi:ribonuclease VapC